MTKPFFTYQNKLLKSLRISDSLGISGYVTTITPSMVFLLLRDNFLEIDTKASLRPVLGSLTKKRLSFRSSVNFQKIVFMISPKSAMSASLKSSIAVGRSVRVRPVATLDNPFWYPKNQPVAKNTPKKNIALNPIFEPIRLGACHV